MDIHILWWKLAEFSHNNFKIHGLFVIIIHHNIQIYQYNWPRLLLKHIFNYGQKKLPFPIVPSSLRWTLYFWSRAFLQLAVYVFLSIVYKICFDAFAFSLSLKHNSNSNIISNKLYIRKKFNPTHFSSYKKIHILYWCLNRMRGHCSLPHFNPPVVFLSSLKCFVHTHTHIVYMCINI